MPKRGREKRPETLLLSEIQVLLSEKRTFYAILRTGLAVVALPLSIIGFLIVSKEYHNLFDKFWLGAIVVGFLLFVSLAGLFLVIKSGKKLKVIDGMIRDIEREDNRVDKLVID